MKVHKPKRKNGQCTKIRYFSKKDAREALNSHGKQMGARRYYKCNICKDRVVWHLTSQESPS